MILYQLFIFLFFTLCPGILLPTQAAGALLSKTIIIFYNILTVLDIWYFVYYPNIFIRLHQVLR